MDREEWVSTVRAARDIVMIGLGVILALSEIVFRPDGTAPDPLVLGLITLLLGFPVGSLADRIRGE
jgi:hypothetical protein